ncbi:hypothetical protein ISS03_02820 [Patescibacteria group bacterium]|nr:hypothetical protein [Patescibacteria group bacterium]
MNTELYQPKNIQKISTKSAHEVLDKIYTTKDNFIQPETFQELTKGLKLLDIQNWKLPNIIIKFAKTENSNPIKGRTEVKNDEICVIFDKRFIEETEGDENSLLNQLKQGGYPGVDQVLKHELAHIGMWSVTEQERQPAIRLLDEGWARLIEDASGKNMGSVNDLTKQAKQDVLNGLKEDYKNYEKCLDFNNPPSQYEYEDLGVAEYEVGKALLLWIRERYGNNEAMINLIKNSPDPMKRNDDRLELSKQFPERLIEGLSKDEASARAQLWEREQFQKALIKITGLISLEKIEEEFKKWLECDPSK